MGGIYSILPVVCNYMHKIYFNKKIKKKKQIQEIYSENSEL